MRKHPRTVGDDPGDEIDQLRAEVDQLREEREEAGSPQRRPRPGLRRHREVAEARVTAARAEAKAVGGPGGSGCSEPADAWQGTG